MSVSDCLVLFEIANRSAGDVYWLNRFFDDRGKLIASIFEVNGKQGLLPYSGVLVEMEPPRAEDFELLPAGDFRRFEVRLGEYYPIKQSERYRLRGSTYVAWFPAPLQTESLKEVSIDELSSAFVSFTCEPKWFEWIPGIGAAVLVFVAVGWRFSRRRMRTDP